MAGVMFDLTDIEKVLTEDVKHEYEGTCELCNSAWRLLSKVGGVYICDKCRNTITANIKESNHPFVAVRAVMNPAYAGDGQPGQRRPLPPAQGSLAAVFKAFYTERLRETMEQAPVFQQLIKPNL